MNAETEYYAIHNALTPDLRELWLDIGRSILKEMKPTNTPTKRRPVLRLVPSLLGAPKSAAHHPTENDSHLLIRKPVGGQ